MITLTDAVPILSVLGDAGSAVGYNKAVVNPLTYDALSQVVTGTLRLTSTTNPSLPAILGTLTINLPAASAQVVLPQADFQAHISMNGAQQAVVQGWIDASQTQVEQGLLTINMVAGVHTPGT